MSKSLDFTKLKKKYLTVTLNDKDQTSVMIGTPTKKALDDLLLLKESMEAVNDEELDGDIVEDLYDACARVMSHNKGGIVITTEHLSEVFDFEDIIIFFDAYLSFVNEITKEKN